MTNSFPEQHLVDLVIEWVRANQRSGNKSAEITADTDLIGGGLLDSFGFVDLLVYVESVEGCKINLAEADPAEFTTVKGLCRMALNMGAKEPNDANRFESDRGDLLAARGPVR
jgi:acyl carrier protein